MSNYFKFLERFTNLDRQTKFYFYLFLGLFLTGCVIGINSINTYRTYDNSNGYSFTLGSYFYNQSNFINNLSVSNFPQGDIGQNLGIHLQFNRQQSSSNVSLYVLLISGGKLSSERNYTDNVLNNIIPNLNEQNMRNYTSQIEKVSYFSSNKTDFYLNFNFYHDNAYSIVFLLSSNSIKFNPNLVLNLTVNYKITGNDNLFLFFSILLIFISLVVLVLFAFFGKKFKENQDNFHDLNNSLAEIKNNYINNINKEIPSTLFQIKSMFKYEFRLLFKGPFLFIYLFLIAVMFQDTYNSVYNFWGPMGKYFFQEFGPSISSNGILKYTSYLFIILTILLLFLFREIDENIFEIHITLPRERKWYIITKYLTFLFPILIFWLIFIITTFIIIPFRNPTIGFYPFSQVLIVSLAYLFLTLFLFSIPLLFIIISMNSRVATSIWVLLYLFWYSWSESYLNQIIYNSPKLSKSVESNLILTSLDRIFEFLIKRPAFPDLSSGYFIYIYDSLFNTIFILTVYLIFSLLIFFIMIFIFERRDL